MLKKLLKSFGELLYPPVCRVCGRRLLDSEEFLCGDCRSALPVTMLCDEPRHNFLSAKFDDLGVDRACCYFIYDKRSPYSNIIREIKFGGDRRMGIAFGRQFGALIESSGEFEDIDTIVPIPLHRYRQHRRGYNQSGVVAEGISKAMGIPVCDTAVRRVKHTRPQSKLTKGADRKKNIKGAFRVVDVPALKDKRILVIDDVTTTGETMSEFIRTVRKACPHVNINIAPLSAVKSGT